MNLTCGGFALEVEYRDVEVLENHKGLVGNLTSVSYTYARPGGP